MSFRIGNVKIPGVQVYAIREGDGKWARPAGWPDLYSLDISNEEALYLTYKTNEDNSFAAFKFTSTGSWYVDIGTIQNATYVVKETSEALSSGDSYLKDLRGYAEDYVVLRVRGIIRSTGYGGVFGNDAVKYDKDGRSLFANTQLLLEAYGRLPSANTIQAMFRGSRFITSVRLIDMESLTTIERAFNETTRLQNVYISGTVERVHAYLAFQASPSVIYVYLNGMKLGNINQIFSGTSLTFSDIETCDVVNTDVLTQAFYGTRLKSYNFKHWSVNATSAINCFSGTRCAEVIDVSTWVINGSISGMFQSSGISEMPQLADWSGVTVIGGIINDSSVSGDIVFPEAASSVTSFGNALDGARCVTSITIPAQYTTIPANAFRNTSNCKEIHFLATTPPTLENSNAFTSGTNKYLQIFVPYSSDHSVLEAYQTASNWSNVASIIIEESE